MERAVLISFVAASIVFGWFLLDFSAWFIPASWLAYSAIAPALVIGWFLARWKPKAKVARMFLEQLSGKDSAIIRLGMTLIIGVTVWLFVAQAIPAGWTSAMGNEQTIEKRVVAYYSGASGTCSYRVILEDFNPFGGGFCFYNDPRLAIRSGVNARLKVQESMLGTFVRSIESASNL